MKESSRKILVANRGEIAVRVLRACQELGMRTVAVYSTADRNALHVRYADEAYLLGPPPSAESYLRKDKIIEIAKACGADAIHPGYGFLAENPEFSRAVTEAGLVFIGPSPESMRMMGNKVEARRIADEAGMPIIPGCSSDLTNDEIVAFAETIGYPVMVKAAAGGGGKGMRVVRDAESLPAALDAARRESTAAFGDPAIFIEKLVENGRHIEIQILADQHGNCVYLGERECSIQRRHQKLVEESPSPFVDEAMRKQMGEVAVAGAKRAGYVNAGTMEFLVDRDRNFYFLEMNTRLQVEHPVTELVTGVDIVKEQIRIAFGRRLRYKQEDIKLKGHAIEARITAEDPYNNFLPSIGTIASLTEPTGPGVRVESALYEGMEVTLHYDPMVAKLIVHGTNRANAIMRLRRALGEYRILGIKSNIPFHQRLVENWNFQAGNFDTGFLAANPDLMDDWVPSKRRTAAIAATILAHRRRQQALVMVGGVGDSPSQWKIEGRRRAVRRN
ncbi:MAG: acetyl-CoA carboxylase biotin carboxylase subunit [Ardenticatenales bacterium]|nr:acetyl-CoA carboxylase biotin carboxylase subunit [Ardenticatenales bacterium]MCB9172658.1 acetyl-CoA carboxylase biotin carboxylase subunit [Ardenticatenales bacterium]